MFKSFGSEYRRIFKLLSKSNIASFSLLTSAYAITEGFGVSMIYPIVKYIEIGPSIFEAGRIPVYWGLIFTTIGKTGLPVGLPTLLLITFAAILLRQIFYLMRQSYLAKVEAKIWNNLRNIAFTSYMHSDLSYVSGESQGRLANVLILETHRAGEAVVGMLMLIGALSLVGLYIFGLIMISPILMPVIPITIIFAGLVVNRWMKQTRSQGEITSAGSDHLNSSISERISGVRLVKMASQEKMESATVRHASEQVGNAIAKLRTIRAIIEGVVEPIFFIGVLAILYAGVTFLNLSLASLGLFFVILLRMVPLAKEINSHRQGISGAMASLRNVQDTIKRAQGQRNITDGKLKFPGLKNSIQLQNIYFSYSTKAQDYNTLTDISLTIKKGTTLAIVGHSGSGKSTLVELLPRLHDPNHGIILIDDTPISNYELASLRRAIGFVDQDIFLFNDTIHNNISYGSKFADRDDVITAAQKAFAHEFITSQADGYDTRVGDNGIRLSAGQKQRIGIARIMFNDPDIVILDEPTSALDSVSEEYIRSTLMDIKHNKTIIIVAHRLSTIRNADEIIVIDKGQIIERGTHQQLLQNQGKYTQLFDLQTNIPDI